MNNVSGKPRAAECEPDPDLRENEQVPLLEEIRADIVALEKETKGLLESIIEGELHSKNSVSARKTNRSPCQVSWRMRNGK
jgi:hypothetical protein